MNPNKDGDGMERFYTRRGLAKPQTTTEPVEGGTVFGGTRVVVPNVVTAAPKVAEPLKPQAKQLCGLLVSYSMDGDGQYWPLYEGTNTIGSDAKSNVTLVESSVGPHHAELKIKQGDDGLEAVLSDFLTAGGTYVNGSRLSTQAVACSDRDILQFGNRCQMLLVLIERAKYGLKTADEYESDARQHPEDESTSVGATVFDSTLQIGK
jgi:hypothetical protein